MKSHEEFQNQFSSVMEKLLHSAISETTKLFDKTVHEMKAELARIRKQNDVLKDNLFTDDIPSPTCKVGYCKRDIGIQCDATPNRVERSCSPLQRGDTTTTLPPGLLQDGNQQFALVFVKKEESDAYDETQTCLFAKISEDQPKQLLVQHVEASLLSQEANLIPVRLAAYQGALERPTVSLTRLSSSDLSAAQKGTLTLPQQPSANTADGSVSTRTEQVLVPKAEPIECDIDVDVETVDSPQSADHLRRTSARQTTSKYRRSAESETSPAGANNTHTHTQTKASKDTAAVKSVKVVKIPKQSGRELSGKTHRHKNQCDVCDRVLSSATSLECHRRIHSGERPWVCERCGKGFPDGRGLRRHLLIHNPKRHQCTDCGKTFVYVFQLRNHQVIHTNAMEYECKVCGKRFKSKSTRATHMHLHTGEKPFTCNICSKKFRHRMSYNTHMQRHRGEKRYVCLTCKKPFADPNNLKAHKRVHTGERPYQCNVCDKRFKQSAHLKKHMATQH